jgi:hypothetical protein
VIRNCSSSRPAWRRIVLQSLLLSALTALSAPSVAQTDKAAAEALFREGMRLSKAGHWAEACPKLEESQRQEPSLGTQYYLAECYEHIGRTATAWANFTEVADKARLAKEAAKEEAARKRANELEPKLAHLTLQVAGGPLPNLVVRRGDRTIGPGQWGLAVPLDPGSYVLRATAPGYKEWSKTIEVAPGVALTEQIPPLEPFPKEATAAAGPSAGAPAPRATAETAPAAAASSAQRTVGIVVAVGGAVVLAASGGAAILAKNANADSNGAGKCHGDSCTPSGLDDRDRAVALADVATVTSIAGGVLLATGGVLWLTAPGSGREQSAAPATQIGFGPRWLGVRGQF